MVCGLGSQGGFLVRSLSLSPLVFNSILLQWSLSWPFPFPSLPGALAPVSPVCVIPQPPQESFTMALFGSGDKSYTSWEVRWALGAICFEEAQSWTSICISQGMFKSLAIEELACGPKK